MKRRPNRKRTDDTRALALSLLATADANGVRLKRVIEAHIERVIAASDGNLSLAAKLLGMHRRSLQRHALRKRPTRRRAKR